MTISMIIFTPKKIIISWTIERMSILWEEEGPKEVLIQGGGSLLTASLVYLHSRFVDQPAGIDLETHRVRSFECRVYRRCCPSFPPLTTRPARWSSRRPRPRDRRRAARIRQ